MLWVLDIGHRYSKCAALDDAGQPRLIADVDGNLRRDTCVLFSKTASPIVGRAARQNAVLEPDRLASDFKPLPAGTANILRSDPPRTKVDALCEIVRSLAHDTETALGAAVNCAVALVPHSFCDDKKAEYREAFANAGRHLSLIAAEQSAAAYAFGLHRATTPCSALVADLGASTCDLALLAIEPGKVHMLAAGGVNWGGADVDAIIWDIVLQEIEAAQGMRPARDSEPLFFLDLESRIEGAKIALNTQTSAPITAAWNGQQHVITVDRACFLQRLEPMQILLLEAVDRVAQDASVRFDEIDHLVLVGGTSRLTPIRSIMSDHTGLTPRTDVDPEFTTVRGGLFLGIEHMRQTGQLSQTGAQVLVPRTVPFTDITAQAVGCAVLDRPTNRLVNACVIPKNTPIPCQRTDEFFLERDDQTEVCLEVLQGEAEADREDCAVIGTLALDNLPRETTRTRRIAVTYALDRNGMVTATARDNVSGQEQSTSIDYQHGVNRRSANPSP